MRGSYTIIMELPKNTEIQIGKLGRIGFPAGYYIYVGSALNNLEKRVERHLSTNKKLHWHIDYLLQVASVRKIMYKEGEKREECIIAKKLSKKFLPIIGFGCSDCNCKSHLFYSKDLVLVENECKKLGMKILGGDGMEKVYLIYSTFGGEKEALETGKILVKERLVACVNVIPKIDSIYWWKGRIEEAKESLLLAKTTEEKVRNVIERIKELHEYELPAIIAIEIKEGLRDFISYVNESCA